MGRRGRRTVLQLGDSSEGFLAKYGYNRQEEEVQGGNDESDEDVEEDGREMTSIETNLFKPKENGDHIDNQVANFLAQLEQEDSNDALERPSFGIDSDVQPSFKLNPDQKPGSTKDAEPSYVSTKARSMYKNMFVKGDSEFTGRSDQDINTSQKEADAEWPEEPTTVWQQTLDDNTQCYYYWNTVTNEVTWEIPPDFTQYLLLRKSYEEKVAKLLKEGKVKPEKKISEHSKVSSSVPHMPPSDQPSPAALSRKKEIIATDSDVKEDKSTDNKPGTTSSKKTLVAYFDSDADSSGSDSESGEDKKKAPKKKKDSELGDDKNNAQGAKKDSDEDLDLDDIDKALEVALEKKKSKSSKESESSDRMASRSKSESKPSIPKKLTLIDSIKEQVQRKMEVEARRKAAIEEMMARELERRVGPPRKRSHEEETVWDSKRTKIVDYGHSRSRSPVLDPELKSDDRDSRRRHDRDKESDRHGHKEKKKKKDKDKDRERDDHRHRDEKRRDHDKHDKDHKERKKDKKKDKEEKRRDKEDKKDRDEKKDKDREEKDREKDRKKDKHEEKKVEEKDQEKIDKKESDETKKMEVKSDESTEVTNEIPPEEPKEVIVKQEVEDKVVKKTLDVDIDAELENIVTGAGKLDVEIANKKMQASELADLALSKLEFLEVTKKGLSKLQILLVELETRHQDWQAGGLNTEFYMVKLEEANWQLEQYERSAAPPGWSCHWDRSYRRYFYMNKKTKQTQWDYPDDDDDEEDDEGRDSSPDHQTVVKKEPVEPSQPSKTDSEIVTSTTLEQDEVTTTKDVLTSTYTSQGEKRYPRKSDEWPNYDAITNYISGTEYSGVIRGEPPPPGTDLEFLLTAPPPPPPPIEEEETGASYDVPGPPEGLLSNGSLDGIDGVAMEDGNDYSEVVQSDRNEQYNESDMNLTDPTIIARPPQIFTDNAYSSYYDANTGSSEQYQDMGPYYSESSADVLNAMETAATGDAASSQQEKKKKKKEKQSSGHLKNKNVSNLVQKWQKVKKEVEIEEQEREERQQAIRQKLDEWKKEHS